MLEYSRFAFYAIVVVPIADIHTPCDNSQIGTPVVELLAVDVINLHIMQCTAHDKAVHRDALVISHPIEFNKPNPRHRIPR